MRFETFMKCLGGLVLALSAVFLVIGGRHVVKANASAGWPAVDGRIVSSGMAESKQDEGVFFWVHVAYQYSVGQRVYSGTRVNFAPDTIKKPRKAREIMDRYPSGKTVKVFYNPANPVEAVLEPGEVRTTWDRVALGIVLFALGWLLWSLSRKEKKKKGRVPPSPSFSFRVQFRFDLLFVCLWIAGGLIMARTFQFVYSGNVFMATAAVVGIGVCLEALWRRSWRVFRRNVKAVLAVFAWQIFLRQCGVSHLSLDILTFIIASTVVAVRREQDPAGRVTAESADDVSFKGERKTAATGESEDMPPETAASPGGVPVKPVNLKWVGPKAVFYVLSGFVLFLVMMKHRQWAEEAQSSLQPMYAWLAALAFSVMVYGGCHGPLHWRCGFCGAELPERSSRKVHEIRCRKCGKSNPC